MARRQKTIAEIDASIKRWNTRLARAMTALAKLTAQRKRAVKAAQRPPVTMIAIATPLGDAEIVPGERVTFPVAAVEVFEADNVAGYHPGQGNAERIARGALPKTADEKAAAVLGDLDIPDFLRRETARKLDKVEAELIKAETETKRLAKSRGRIAKMKAKKAGDTKKMPLSGKAALDHIRNG